jgi:hypothetical protein
MGNKLDIQQGPVFDLEGWKQRFRHNAEEAERNSSMDSGWSLQTAQHCEATALSLYREIVEALAATTTNAEDFFDRPKLVAIQEAARYSQNGVGEGKD